MGQREQLVTWVEQHPGRCDDCAADALAFASRQRANQLGRALAASGVLSRAEAVCAGCGTTKAVSCLGTGVAPVSAVRRSAERVLDGYHALEQVLARAGYPSVVSAVVAHTVFRTRRP